MAPPFSLGKSPHSEKVWPSPREKGEPPCGSHVQKRHFAHKKTTHSTAALQHSLSKSVRFGTSLFPLFFFCFSFDLFLFFFFPSFFVLFFFLLFHFSIFSFFFFFSRKAKVYILQWFVVSAPFIFLFFFFFSCVNFFFQFFLFLFSCSFSLNIS